MLKRWVPLWTIPVLIAFAVGTVWVRLAIVRTTYSINETERMIRNARLERDQVELKLAAQRSPRRLQNLAKTKFGLRQPHSEQVVYFK